MDIIGSVEKIFFQSESWSAFRIRTDDDEVISCSGVIIGLVLNMRLKLSGEYKIHPKYGEQFSFDSYEVLVGNSLTDIERYLTSSAISGIGPKLAQKIIEEFGTSTIDIIRNHPEKLSEIRGISKKKAQSIHESEANSQVFQVLLSYAELTPRQALTLYEHYKEKTISIVKNTPYMIIHELPGFGFKTVDKIALKNGTPYDSPDRIAAAITFCLTSIGDLGHCFTTIPRLETTLAEFLPKVDVSKIATVLADEISSNRVIQDGMNIYSSLLYNCEKSSADNIAKLLTTEGIKVPSDVVNAAIKNMENRTGFTLEMHQRNAILAALQNNLTVITGGPGTGKSSIIQAIVDGWILNKPKGTPLDDCVKLCAPTGKAARRMADLSNCKAETIQKLVLRWEKSCEVGYDGNLDLRNCLLIVDESSMIDIYLASKILKMATENKMKVVFIGDTHQLPPIGPGNFFKDLCDSPCVPSITLRLCFRQQGTIAINAKRINEGVNYSALNFDDPSFQFIPALKEVARERVIDAYFSLAKEYGLANVSCIVPMRKKGKSQTSSDDLNEIIRERVNPYVEGTPSLQGVNLRIGDRVMQTVNDYNRDVYNGDCGFVETIDTFNSYVYVKFDSGKTVEYSAIQCNELIFAYAITVHRAQGSEYSGVVIAHNREHAFMLERNLLYTAVTRAKKKVLLVGEPAAINMATHKMSSHERMRALNKRIGASLVKEMRRS